MAKLKFNRISYLPNRTDLSLKEVKAEYQRLRSIARRRLNKIANTEFSQTNLFKKYNKMYNTSRGGVRGKSESQLRSGLYELSEYVESSYSTLKGLKNRMDNTIKKLSAKGFNVNPSNYFGLIEFLNDKNIQKIAEWLDSDQIMQLWKMRSKGLSLNKIVKEWDKLLGKSDEVNKYLDRQIDRDKGISYRVINDIIGAKSKKRKK